MPSPRAVAALAAWAALGACSGASDEPGADGSRAGAIPGVGTTCPEPPEAVDDTVPGLRLPPGAFLSDVRRQDPVVQATGYVRQTPLEVRAWAEGLRDVQLLRIEDEVREVETLFRSGDVRVYLRGVAVCQTESQLTVLVTPDRAGG